MTDDRTIKIKEYDGEGKRVARSSVSAWILSRSLTSGNFARLLDNYVNSGSKGFIDGRIIGTKLHATHRTLQRLVVCFALGIIAGLSEQEYTDNRNEVAIQTAQKISDMVDSGDLPLGRYI